MKKTVLLLFLVWFVGESYSQIDVKDILKNKTENRAKKRTAQGVDKGLDALEDGVKGAFTKDKSTNTDSKEARGSSNESTDDALSAENMPALTPLTPEMKWAKYDFVPGNKIIFEDNQEDEENGEFPSRWDLVKGRVENVSFDNAKVIFFMTASSQIIPYLKNRAEDYIPEEFTIEFDAWFEKNEYASYHVYFRDIKNQKGGSSKLYNPIVKISANSATNEGNKGYYSSKTYEYNTTESHWRHVSISFNRRALKVYLDDERLLNVPNMEINPTGLSIGIDHFGTAGVKGLNRIIKNIRVAEGAVKLYDKLLQDGKIVSTGIRFDVNKATIKPESMGVINKIYDLLKQHPEIDFSVEGHTDNSGDEDYNLKLSKQRAQAVIDQLISMGVAKDRLNAKGYGETIPLTTNDTPEGKANNRRVEFIKT